MTTNKENWGYPNTVWFGNGRIRDLAKACKHLNIKKPLLITDKDLVKNEMILNAVESNKKDSVTTAIFSDLKGNPLGSYVKNGVEKFKNGNHDGIIAFGGGGRRTVDKITGFGGGGWRGERDCVQYCSTRSHAGKTWQ